MLTPIDALYEMIISEEGDMLQWLDECDRKEYTDATGFARELKMSLQAQLDEKGRKTLDKYVDAMAVSDLYEFKMFLSCGIVIGIQLATMGR